MDDEILSSERLQALLRLFKEHHGAEYGLSKLGYIGSYAHNTATPGEKAANGIAQAAKEITASPGRERAALAEATQETLNPEQPGAPGGAHPKQREYLRQAVLKRMKPLDALDGELFLAVNHLPHNRWFNGFFYFFTFTFSAGLGWYVLGGQ
jgi:hypothetical protein